MASSQIFVDTNILVYAHDRDAAGKHQAAKDRVASLWRLPVAPAISVQVLQELYVNLFRKGGDPLLAPGYCTKNVLYLNRANSTCSN